MLHPEYMGAPMHPLLGAADNYAFPMTNGLLGSLSQSGQPTDWTQVALGLAGNPHAGPYANAQGLAPLTGGAGLLAGSSGGGSSGGSVVTGLLGALAKNPSLIKNAANAVGGLLGGGLGGAAAGDAAAADAAIGSTVAPELAAENASIAAANSAALGGASGAASGAGGAGAAGSLGVMGAVAAPLAIAALAAFMPQNNGLSGTDIGGMEQAIRNATQSNGGPIRAGYDLNPDGTINQSRAQALTDLYTLQGDDPNEFGGSGGLGQINQFLQSLGYSTQRPGAITTVAPGGRGWLGGGFMGQSRA